MAVVEYVCKATYQRKFYFPMNKICCEETDTLIIDGKKSADF